MAVLDPEHLFSQADLLVIPRQPGRPLQVDVRRAVSAAYYGLLHALLTAAADEFVGRRHRGTDRYGIVYRSVDHRHLKEVCRTVQGQRVPGFSFSLAARAFAASVVQLQDRRHAADYDPLELFRVLTAVNAIATARVEIARFAALPAAERKTFLTMLCFKRR